MEVASAVASVVAETFFDRVRREISYVFKYQSHVEDLKSQVKELKYAREMVEQRVDGARRQGDEIYDDVQHWLNSVDDFTEMVEKSIMEAEYEEKSRCFKGLCPDLLRRYNLSKKSVKAAKDGDYLVRRAKFSNVSHPPPPVRMQDMYGRELVHFDSSMPVFLNIMETLKDANFGMIGVYGMGGVGKTTLVKEVARQVMEDKLFDEVVMAQVTQAPVLKIIQDKIACDLGLTFNQHETLSDRAGRLRQRLKGKRVLVILDDIWEELDLEAIGICSEGDGQRQCTVLLISRSLHVLVNMNSLQNFYIGVLSDEEALSLFWRIVGDHSTKTSEFQFLAVEIVGKCGGLPIAIKTIAHVLKNKQLSFWEDALYGLRKSNPRQVQGMDANVYSSIQLSYNLLESHEEKSLFLLCGLINDSSPIFIDDLMRYAMGLDLFGDVYTLAVARSRVQVLILNLKASCLLLDGDIEGQVKMHDVIHDVAVSIAANKLMFHIQYAADLKGELENNIHKDAIAISIAFGETHELPERLECPKLELLCIFAEKPTLQIPDHFFEGMKELKVLDLTRFHFLSLPSSLGCLFNLRTLTLQSCVLADIAIVGELRKLEILSFRDSDIEQLPGEFGNLTRLKLLDLTNCSKLEVIRPNVLSNLSRLEELYMGNSFTKWEVEGQSNASLIELKQLSRLTTLDIHIPDLHVIPQDLIFKEFERYRIFIGDVWSWSSKNETSRTLKLKLNESNISWFVVKKLLKGTEALYLDELISLKNHVSELDDGEGFPLLKHLHLQNAHDILYIVALHDRATFSRLESLFLDSLINLKKICHDEVQFTADYQSFRNLKIINVEGCHSLKHLFSWSMAKILSQLQEIEVSDCNNLKMIVGKESGDSITGIINFTKLHSLTLQDLPQLSSSGFNSETPATTFSSSKEIISADDPEDVLTLFNNKVMFPSLEKLILSSINIEKIWRHHFPAMSSCSQNLTILKVESCNRLKFLLSSSVANSLVRLLELVIQGCESMEVVIDTRLEKEEQMTRMAFPKLFHLELQDLPKLTTFGIGNSIEFPSLSECRIDGCPNLETYICGSIWQTK